MRKLTRVLAAAAAFSLVIAACGGDDDEDSGSSDTEASAATGGAETTAPADDGTETTAPADDGTETTAPDAGGSETTAAGGGGGGGEGMTVGLLFDITGRGDKSFNDSAAEGLDQAVEDFGIVASESTPTGDSDRADRLNLLVSEGNGLVIGVGFLWTDSVVAGATANPDTLFGLVDAVPQDNNGTPDDFSDDKDLPNAAGLVFAEEQGSFLVGAAAALKSESGKLGFVGGVETDLIKKFEAGFIAGAEHINPDIEILSQYVSQPPDFNGFNDSAKGKEIAAAMYADGADVVYHAAGATGLGVFEAAKEAGEPGSVWAIGVDSDQYNQVSADLQPYILTSMLKRVNVAVYETIKDYVEGNFQPGARVFDLEADGVGYSTTGGFVDDIAAELDGYAEQIISGEIEVPTSP
jgi:basic membrane protein A and related proteins